MTFKNIIEKNDLHIWEIRYNFTEDFIKEKIFPQVRVSNFNECVFGTLNWARKLIFFCWLGFSINNADIKSQNHTYHTMTSS